MLATGVPPFTATEMGPVVASGTRTVNSVAVADTTLADTPLNRTELFAGVLSKLVPSIVTFGVL